MAYSYYCATYGQDFQIGTAYLHIIVTYERVYIFWSRSRAWGGRKNAGISRVDAATRIPHNGEGALTSFLWKLGALCEASEERSRLPVWAGPSHHDASLRKTWAIVPLDRREKAGKMRHSSMPRLQFSPRRFPQAVQIIRVPLHHLLSLG